MSRLSEWIKKLKARQSQADEGYTFCCVYGTKERPKCWQHRAHLAQAEIDCAYHAIKKGYPSGTDKSGACVRPCDKQ